MKNISFIVVVLAMLGLSSCKDFLNVVPDNVATIDNAFTNKADAERYLFTCYSYSPREPDVATNPAMFGGDEFWIYSPIVETYAHVSQNPILLARGEQNVGTPYMNFWNGENGGLPLFKGIRDCNIFLDNVDKVGDLEPDKKARWIAEAKFLKAYYHFYLLRMYGPIPTVKINVPITAESDEIRVHRDPFDSTVNYIVKLLDEAAPDLPLTIQNRTSELGRITKPIALAIKAKVLVTAASPLFNGNADFKDLVHTDGTPLISATADNQKWERAATACKEAIDVCEANGHKLFTFTSLTSLNDSLILEMSIRNSVCEKWNPEIIWGSTNGSTANLQIQCMARVDPTRVSNQSVYGQMAPPLKIVEMFYSDNGVPITEDKTWDVANMYNVKTATNAQRIYLQPGYQTAGLNMKREPRFYADLAFDGSKWFMQNGTWNIQAKSGQTQARKAASIYSITGYFTKKLVNWKFEIKDGQDYSLENYSWPIMRMADLYLLYAEALNEAKGPDEADVLTYLNKIRTRAGLKTVEVSWSNYSNNPNKYKTKEGLRDIIHRERLIELAFEGSRFWDLRRWKEAVVTQNESIYGWNIEEETAFNYYKRTLLFTQSFVAPRDYLWPIKTDEIITNRNILQNTGW